MRQFFNSGSSWIYVQSILALLSIHGNCCQSPAVNGKLMPFIDQKGNLKSLQDCYKNPMTIPNWAKVGSAVGLVLSSFGDPSGLDLTIINSNFTDDTHILDSVAAGYCFARTRNCRDGTIATAKLKMAGIRLNVASSANNLGQEALMVQWYSKEAFNPEVKSVMVTMSTEFESVNRVPLLLTFNNNYFPGGFVLRDTVFIIFTSSNVKIDELIGKFLKAFFAVSEFKQSLKGQDGDDVVIAVRIQPRGFDCTELKLQILSVPGVMEVYIAEVDSSN